MVLPRGIVANQIVQDAPVRSGYPTNSTEAALCRTFNPTYASYSGDGTGRDSYIILNNGGLSKEPKRNMMWQSLNKCRPDIRVVGHKPTPTHKYKSDGSGRDSYVIRNQGGLVNDFRCSQADSVFKSGLRANIPSPLRAADTMNATNFTANWKTPREKAMHLAHLTF